MIRPGTREHPVADTGATADSALAVVGLTVDDIDDVVNAQLEGGHAYITGSLAAGLGSPGSDLDIHILRPDLTTSMGPFMRFVGDVVIDIECYPAQTADLVRDAAGAVPTVDSALGPIAAEHPADPVFESRIVPRWLHATPLRASSPPIFDAGAQRAILPVLVRRALDCLVRSVALARLADAADTDDEARRYLWREASRYLLDLRCGALGDVTTNLKWLPSRVARLNLPDPTLAGDEAGYRDLARRALLPDLDEWQVSSLRPASERQPVRLGDRAWALTRNGRLLSAWSDETGSVAEVVERIGASAALAAVRTADLDLEIDAHGMREALSK